jgi:DNA-binding LacI/PurR family transcriptional regulator
LILGRTFTIGFIVGELSEPVRAHLARRVKETLEASGCIYLLANTAGTAERQHELAMRLLERKADGGC